MAAASILQAAARVYLARRRAAGRMLAVLRIQAALRTCLARRRATTRRRAVLKIQAVWRESNLSKDDTQDEGKCKHIASICRVYLLLSSSLC